MTFDELEKTKPRYWLPYEESRKSKVGFKMLIALTADIQLAGAKWEWSEKEFRSIRDDTLQAIIELVSAPTAENDVLSEP